MIDKLAMGLITIGGQVYKVAPSVARRLAKEYGIKGASKAQAEKVKKPIKLTSANATKLAQSSKKNKAVTLGQDKVPLSSSQKKLKNATQLAQGSGKNKVVTLGQDKVPLSASQKKLKMAKTQQGPRTPKLKKSNLRIQPVKKKSPTGQETKQGIKTGTGTKTTGTGTKTTVKKPLTTSKTRLGKVLNKQADFRLGSTIMRGGKKAGTVVSQGGKKFIKSPTGRLIGVAAAAGAGGYYLGSSGDKPKPTQAGTASKPPKPTAKPPKPDYAGASFTDTEEATIGENVKPKKLSFEEKLRAKFIKGRGGKDAFKSDKQIDSAFESELMEMREGADAGFSLKDQEDYQKVMDERGSKGKKAGGQVKRKYGGVVKRRGGMQVGKVTNPSRIKSTIKMANGGGVGNKFIASLYK